MNASEYNSRVSTSGPCNFSTAPAFQRVQSTLVAVLNTHLGKYRMSNVAPSSAELDVMNVQLIELLELHPVLGKEAKKERARRAMQMASRGIKPLEQTTPHAASEGAKNDSCRGYEDDTKHFTSHEVDGNGESSSKLEEAKNLLAGILKRELKSSAADGKNNASEHCVSQESSMSGSSGQEDTIFRYGNPQHRVTSLLAQAMRNTQHSENSYSFQGCDAQAEKSANVALSSVVQQIKNVLQSEAANDALVRQTLASTVHSRKRKDRTEDEVAVHALMALNDSSIQKKASNAVA